MQLILVRHGQALNHDIDALRPLSKEGQEEARQTGLFINDLSKKPIKVIHSELLRAKETAQIIAKNLTINPAIVEEENLLPNSSIEIWQNSLMAYDQNIALVGHMPFMGIFASELLGRPLSFPTGGSVVLERQDSGHWKLIKSNF